MGPIAADTRMLLAKENSAEQSVILGVIVRQLIISRNDRNVCFLVSMNEWRWQALQQNVVRSFLHSADNM